MTKSVRLTNDMRDDILSSVVKQWKAENPKPDIEQAQHDFACAIHKRYYSKKDLDILAGVPRKFLKLAEFIQVAINGEVDRFHFLKGEELPRDWSGSSYNAPILFTLDDTDKDYKKYAKIKEAFEDWKQRGHELERETRAVLDSVNTSKQLIELWAEVEPFLPAHIADPDKGVKLPAIQISRLNERLGMSK